MVVPQILVLTVTVLVVRCHSYVIALWGTLAGNVKQTLMIALISPAKMEPAMIW